ncbi:MAG: efflux RND transporter permease subunit, partial [Candidatus Latescibacterota bacterium]|nr:efflux RND transporter permease subunit [Candidatus Latescibacterota bacterium]
MVTEKPDDSRDESRDDISGHLLPRLSVDRPISVIMVLVAMLVVGAIAYTRIPLGLIPEGHEGDRLHIRVDYPSASPEEVEQKVMRPI